jgi:hypothetical protein
MDMTACQSIEAVKYMVPIELNPTSHCPGAVEAACKLLNNKVFHFAFLRYLDSAMDLTGYLYPKIKLFNVKTL